jgi:hypothetical protein
VISSEAARLGEEAARRLAQAGGYEIGPGLTDAEFARIERKYEFEFADDHRAFLAAGLPLNIPQSRAGVGNRGLTGATAAAATFARDSTGPSREPSSTSSTTPSGTPPGASAPPT